MFAFLLIVQILIASSLVLVILMQRSEGGGLGVGGSSSGFMTARGAADFLTRSTSILGGAFIILSIVMAAIAGATRQAPTIDTSLGNSVTSPQTAPAQPQQPSPADQAQLKNAAAAPVTGTTTPANSAAPANQGAPAVPLAQ
ncbi:preprotein translocase subunit SecG [Sphingomonas sp.]|uniref:preprotein translocase subunit SecG n=1 Tax=Sphingomonas sp. TaxID=28214 RepID=UPI0025FC10FC|nr:preprotein translocase subunit SecG [Sphingomonas sp.]MBV9527689.1 preprotein translocase subunit SecG [Sphingomonas sp.]